MTILVMLLFFYTEFAKVLQNSVVSVPFLRYH